MSTKHLHAIRDAELKAAMGRLPPPGQQVRILDLGAGTGHQSALLASMGYSVTAMDLSSSAYVEQRVYPVLDYDGQAIPLQDRTVDVVFTSNVLEHVKSLDGLLSEIARVLAPDGLAIHILPTTAWRCWTTLTYYPWLIKRVAIRAASSVGEGRNLVVRAKKRPIFSMLWPERHGERGNFLSEAWYFSESWWRNTFTRAGFDVVACAPTRLAYTGGMLFADYISIAARRRWASFVGSSCRIYVVRQRPSSTYMNQRK